MSTTSGTTPRETLLDVRGLTIGRRGLGDRGVIVKDLSLQLEAGGSVAIVGESGSGKSMTAKALVGLLPDGVVASGHATFRGQDLVGLTEREWRGLRGTRIGLVMQDPFTMLNPLMRCGAILQESLQLGQGRRSRAELRAEALRRLAEVGITDPAVADRYPFQLSGGMRQRIAIAAALARDPDVLIADEPSTALDVITQREVLALIKRIQVARGMGLVLITHDLRVAFATCERIQVLYAGSLVEQGAAADVQREPLHPYTHGLLLSEPPADRRVQTLVAIPGSVPLAKDVQDRCAFAARCAWARPECRDGIPELRPVEEGRGTRCVRIEEIRGELAQQRSAANATARPTPGSRTGDVLVEVVDVEMVFGGASGVRAVDGVSLTVHADEAVGIVGTSGSGKTTVARMVVGLETPTAGRVVIDGIPVRDWRRLSARDRQRLRGTVQTVFQDPYSTLNPMRTVGWALEEAIRSHRRTSTTAMRAEVGALLEQVGLPASHAQRRPAGLSGGERQRIAIARALAVGPRVLICDEPVSALDVSVQAQIMNLLEQVRAERGISSLFITHDLAIARQASEFLYVMNQGRVVESGPTASVLDHPAHDYTAQLLGAVPRSGDAWLDPSPA